LIPVQVEAKGHDWRALQQAFLSKQRQQERAQQAAQQQQQQQQWLADGGSGSAVTFDAWPGQPPALAVDAAVGAMIENSSNGSSNGQLLQQAQQFQQQQHVAPPYAPPQQHDRPGSSGRKSQRAWSVDDVRLAAGNRAASSGMPVAQHPLRVESAYRAVTGSEAAYTTCHDK